MNLYISVVQQQQKKTNTMMGWGVSPAPPCDECHPGTFAVSADVDAGGIGKGTIKDGTVCVVLGPSGPLTTSVCYLCDGGRLCTTDVHTARLVALNPTGQPGVPPLMLQVTLANLLFEDMQPDEVDRRLRSSAGLAAKVLAACELLLLQPDAATPLVSAECPYALGVQRAAFARVRNTEVAVAFEEWSAAAKQALWPKGPLQLPSMLHICGWLRLWQYGARDAVSTADELVADPDAYNRERQRYLFVSPCIDAFALGQYLVTELHLGRRGDFVCFRGGDVALPLAVATAMVQTHIDSGLAGQCAADAAHDPGAAGSSIRAQVVVFAVDGEEGACEPLNQAVGALSHCIDVRFCGSHVNATRELADWLCFRKGEHVEIHGLHTNTSLNGCAVVVQKCPVYTKGGQRCVRERICVRTVSAATGAKDVLVKPDNLRRRNMVLSVMQPVWDAGVAVGAFVVDPFDARECHGTVEAISGGSATVLLDDGSAVVRRVEDLHVTKDPRVAVELCESQLAQCLHTLARYVPETHLRAFAAVSLVIVGQHPRSGAHASSGELAGNEGQSHLHPAAQRILKALPETHRLRHEHPTSDMSTRVYKLEDLHGAVAHKSDTANTKRKLR